MKKARLLHERTALCSKRYMRRVALATQGKRIMYEPLQGKTRKGI